VSVWEPDRLHHVAYALCAPDGPALHPGPWRQLSRGSSLYAASAFADRDGRPGLVAWLRGVADLEAGWVGATSLPALVSLDGDRLVLVPPVPTTEGRVVDGPVLEEYGADGWYAQVGPDT